MTKPFKIIMLTTGLVILFGAPTIAWSSTFQASDIILFSNGDPIAGGATMTRDDDSVHVRAALSHIKKKSVYSVWWIIFNNPAGCADGGPGVCGESDVYPGGPADAAVINAAGFITGKDRTGYFVADLEVGVPPASTVAPFGQLNDSMGAEIHMVIQSHGRPVPGSVAFEMTHPTGMDLYGIIFAPPAP